MGMRSATRTLATRRSILTKSSMAICGCRVWRRLSVAKTPEAGASVWGAGGLEQFGGGSGGRADVRAGVVVGERAGARCGAGVRWVGGRGGGVAGLLVDELGWCWAAVGFSASVMSWMSSLGARGKMGPREPSFVPGLGLPIARLLSSPFARRLRCLRGQVAPRPLLLSRGGWGRGER